ncbi:MAG: hypothetical protein H6842_06805 [Rhodospirillaceae bacterium]|nr:hypothetical protein [Rhodospirillaceae bacterium]
MTGFPPHMRLAHVAASLVRRLPDQCATLLASGRFAEGREAIARLADPAAMAAGVRAMAPAEAAWMAELLLARWARIASVTLDPAAAIVAPEEVWLSADSGDIVLSVVTLGFDEGWQADWSGDARPLDDGRQALLAMGPESAAHPPSARVRVRVIGRAGGVRCVAGAAAEVRVRRPVVSVSADRLTLTLRDGGGEPGRGVAVTIDGSTHVTDAAGRVACATPIPPQATVQVAGRTVAAMPPDGGPSR